MPEQKEKTKMKYWLIAIMSLLIVGCTTTPPVAHVIGQRTFVQTHKKFLGIKVATVTQELKTKEQKLEDLEIENARSDARTEERQKAAAFWFGICFFAAAAAFVFAGYFAQGWKFFGGAAAISFALGVSAWSFESVVSYLQYPAYGIAAAVVLWSMWKLKDFALLERLKNSKEGSIL